MKVKSIFKSSLMFGLLMSGMAIGAEYKVDVAKSVVKWTGSKLIGTKSHHGTIQIKMGKLTISDEGLTGGFTIDMNTIVDHDLENEKFNKKLVNHLKSDEFFDAAKHPYAILKITKSYKGKNLGEYMLDGELTIKGITHPVNFKAEVKIENKQLVATAMFTIDRSKWEVKYGSNSFFKSLGDKAIKNEIGYDIKIVANK